MKKRLMITVLILTAVAFIAFGIGKNRAKRFDVVFATDTDSGAALDALIATIAVNHAYGDRDNALRFDAGWEDKLIAGDLQIQCTDIADAAALLIHEAGYRARRVALLTGDEWNGCDDGHQALEVWHPDYGQWLFLDFSTDRLYMQTAEEFSTARGLYRMLTDAPIAEGYVSPCAGSPLAAGEIDAWYDRIAQIVMIADTGGAYYADADHPLAARASEYGYQLMDEWHEHFYNEEHSNGIQG